MSTASDLIHSPRVLVIAHRGNSRAAPENTLPAFESAMRLGVDFVELDYVHSADGVPVVFHDDTLDRTTDACQLWGGYDIRLDSKRFDELRQLDAGNWFGPEFAGTKLSTLAEALDAIDPGAATMIERKGGDASTCIELLTSQGMLDRVTVQAFDWQFLAECHRLAPRLPLGALGDGQLDDYRLDVAKAIGATIIGWDNRTITREGIAAIHARGLKAWVWTVDDPLRARKLIKYGVDGLISNLPAAMQTVVAESTSSNRC